MIKTVLAIETSCDDTSVAIVSSASSEKPEVLSLVSANQDLVHQPFGGVVPEIASRNHTLHLLPLVEQALANAKLSWQQVDGVAVTSRPGLIGSLLVGVMTAKTLALNLKIPFVGINHLEAHLLAPFLRDAKYTPAVDFGSPYLALAVSGGHTQLYDVEEFGKYRVLGRTLDDAAGEAFDKFAKMLGLEFPGGPNVDKLARSGDSKKYEFARPLIHEAAMDFSFSGLKSSAMRLLQDLEPTEIQNHLADLCASFQEAVVDVLLAKLDQAVDVTGRDIVVLTGGVSANTRLRDRAAAWAQQNSLTLLVPPLRFCTDNAAMVGLVGWIRLNKGQSSSQDLKPLAASLETDFL